MVFLQWVVQRSGSSCLQWVVLRSGSSSLQWVVSRGWPEEWFKLFTVEVEHRSGSGC
jgi:hypothetical protein